MLDVLKNLNFSTVTDMLIRVVMVLVCLTLHELAHGLAAYKLGDNTAKERGRLTLNPIKHIDVFGLLMMIFVGFGWAKPVPVDPNNFKHPKRDMAITALAGPVTNLLIAAATMAIGGLAFALFTGDTFPETAIDYFLQFVWLSIGLGIFNLIPIPPLDGSKVLFSFLPDSVYSKILKYERFGFILLIGLTYLGVFNTFLSAAITKTGDFMVDYIFLPLYRLIG